MPVQDAGPGATKVLARRYRVDTRLAAGGMGTVHRGWDQRLDRPVAIKLLHPHLAADAEVRSRFHAEARHAARVRHANAVAVLDADEHDGLPFIVMELVDGPSLRDLLDRRGRLSPGEVLTLLTGVCAGLNAVHAVDLVHRDIKPENLLHDTTGRVRVADFGIARALDSTQLTPAGTILGSVQYLAPEVVLGTPATAASDQYSLGIVTFEALTGQTPLPAEVPLAAAIRHAREQVPAPSTVCPDLPPAVDRVVTTATAKNPDDRFASLDALLAALRDAVTANGRAHPPRTRPPTALLPASRAPTRRRSNGDAPAATASAAQRRPAVVPAPVDRRDVPAEVATSRPAARSRPAEPPRRSAHVAAGRPIFIRARMSALAWLALASTLFEVGVVAGPLLGLLALRRIDRSHGRLRGEAIAALAIVIGLLRLAGRLAT